jgi:hypothetical protein
MKTTVKPDVAQRVQAANFVVQSKLTTWGPLRVMHGAALVLLAIGTILPVATITQFEIFSSSTSNVRIFDFGPGGWLFLLLGVLLGAAPFVLALTRRATMAAFGAGACGLGSLLVGVVAAKPISAFAQIEFGYYALVVAFGIIVIAYWRRFWNAATVHDSDAEPAIETVEAV